MRVEEERIGWERIEEREKNRKLQQLCIYRGTDVDRFWAEMYKMMHIFYYRGIGASALTVAEMYINSAIRKMMWIVFE